MKAAITYGEERMETTNAEKQKGQINRKKKKVYPITDNSISIMIITDNAEVSADGRSVRDYNDKRSKNPVCSWALISTPKSDLNYRVGDVTFRLPFLAPTPYPGGICSCPLIIYNRINNSDACRISVYIFHVKTCLFVLQRVVRLHGIIHG